MVLKEILRLKQQVARQIDRLRYMPQCHNDLFSLVSYSGDSGYIPLLLHLVLGIYLVYLNSSSCIIAGTL